MVQKFSLGSTMWAVGSTRPCPCVSGDRRQCRRRQPCDGRFVPVSMVALVGVIRARSRCPWRYGRGPHGPRHLWHRFPGGVTAVSVDIGCILNDNLATDSERTPSLRSPGLAKLLHLYRAELVSRSSCAVRGGSRPEVRAARAGCRALASVRARAGFDSAACDLESGNGHMRIEQRRRGSGCQRGRRWQACGGLRGGTGRGRLERRGEGWLRRLGRFGVSQGRCGRGRGQRRRRVFGLVGRADGKQGPAPRPWEILAGSGPA